MSREILYADIGKRIKALREKVSPNQKAFAESLGVKQSWLSELEAGKYKPSSVFLVAIEYRYKVRQDWILKGEGEPYIQPEEKGVSVNEGPAAYEGEEPRIRELLNMARYVLNAKHPEITPALESNIIAFHGAVLRDPGRNSHHILKKNKT